ncbi:endolytic transglycosylase MltG [soil metagenome]
MSKLLKIVAVLCLVVAIGIAGAIFYELQQFKPFSSDTKKVSFTVKKGETAYDVGADLQTKKLIRDPRAFQLYVWKNHLASKIFAGSFTLSPCMSVQQIALELTTEPTSIRVTIKEGLRREEIAEFLDQQDSLTAFDKDEFLTLSKGKEGSLFPDTYIFSREESTQAIYNELTKTFESKVSGDMADEIAKSGHSLKDITIMASLIQREARSPQATAANQDPVEMKIISGILWKRVELGIPLGVDATLQHLKGYDPPNKTWWSTSGIVALKSSSSGFNTYLHLGLPPSPISNPGLFAFQAATSPTATDYLFYLHDTNGKPHYAKTLQEHTQNVDSFLR